MIIPPKSANILSTCGPTLSLLTPLIIVVSDAIIEVKTLAPFSFMSNHPMFFCKIFAYKSCLIFKVTFSLIIPEHIFEIVNPKKIARAIIIM
jgi:hypothetical protein